MDSEAYQDIQRAIDWYNQREENLGYKFYEAVKNMIDLRVHPFFQVRYDSVRCVPIKKFPYMVHFTLDEAEKLVMVRSVLSTARDPEYWKSGK